MFYHEMIIMDEVLIVSMVFLAGVLVIYFYRYIKEQRLYWWTGHPETSWRDHPETTYREERWPSSDKPEEREDAEPS